MKANRTTCAAIAVLTTINAPRAQPAGAAVPVTVENFIRAESHLYFSAVALTEVDSASSSIIANWRLSS
jgi:hypothetical protein